jgi:hypothetical protein
MKKDTRIIAAILPLPLSLGLPSGNVTANEILELEPNDTIVDAQNIDGDFDTGPNKDIENADTWAWVSISANGDGTHDYYSFNVGAAGVIGVFDIDYGSNSGGWVDTKVCLYTANGDFLDENDDADYAAEGAGGSESVFDAYLSYEFTAPGTYVIGVGEAFAECGERPVHADATYELQVSLSEAAQVNDADSDGVADDSDCNPNSDPNPTVVLQDCDSGVTNTMFSNGCNVADLVSACAQGASNHGKFSSCVTAVTNDLARNNQIFASDKLLIQSCTAQTDIGK